MATEFSWSIQALICLPAIDGKKNVVSQVDWKRTAKNGAFTYDATGSQNVTYKASSSFTPFEDLTEAEVIAWLIDEIGSDRIATIDANLDQHINNQMNPPIIGLPLPWATPDME